MRGHLIKLSTEFDNLGIFSLFGGVIYIDIME